MDGTYSRKIVSRTSPTDLTLRFGPLAPAALESFIHL
jgi:hypothetical protein